MLQYSCSSFVSVAEVLAAPAGCSFTAGDDTTLLSAAIDQASDMLCILSGQRIHGICTKIVRPVADYQCGVDPWRTYTGYNYGWNPYNYGSGPDYLQGTIPLRGPNTDVVAIYIDGSLLASTAYGLINDRYLIRKDGASWPTTNDMTRAITQSGTFAVIYRFGRAPDWLTKQATIELAAELALEYSGKATNLPAGVTNVNIQGAQVSLVDRANGLRDGANESIPMVSRFLGVFAPEGMVRSGVWSPELKLGFDLVEDEGPSGS